MDAFSDFVTLVVPKVGQETATWKYDVRRKERKLTVFRLSYEDDMAAVADCLSLQFCPESSDSYTLSPTLFTGGHKKEPAFVQNILGKSSLTSALDIQTLLAYLDDSDDFENNTVDSYSCNTDEVDAVAVALYNFDREGSVDTPFDSYDEEDSEENSDDSWEPPPKKRKAKSRLAKRHPERSDDSPAEEPPKKPRMNADAETSEGDNDISNGKFSFKYL